MEITNYYTAQGEERLTLREFSKIQRGCPKHLGIPTDDSIINRFPFGLWSYTKTYRNYSKMLEVWGIDKLSNDDIFNEFNKLMMDNQDDSLAIQKCYQLKNTEPDFSHFDSKATTEEISNALAIYFSTTYSLDEVAFKFGLWKELLSYYILYLRRIKQYNKRQKMNIDKRRNKKRTSKVIEEIKNLLKSKKYNQFTISSIQAEYNSKAEASNQISRSTCRRMLTEDLKYSYKRWSTVSFKTLTHENIRWYYESVAILSRMKQEDVEVIFFDGYSVDTRKLNFYHWSKRGEPAFLSKSENQFHMSFVIGISSIKIYGLIGVVGSTDSNIIIHYLSEMLCKRNKDKNLEKIQFILCMDNASVHVSEATQKFLVKSKLKAVTIAARWPSLNPTEKIIAWFKHLLRQQAKQGK